MEKLMLIAGCSHAAGSEIDGQEDSVYNRQMSFGSIVAKHFGYTPVHIAQNGMTNTGIARAVQGWCKKHYDPKRMKLSAIVAWTESTRLEVPSTQHYCYELSSKCTDWFDKTAANYTRITFGWEGWTAEEKAIVAKFHRFMAENEIFLEMATMQLVLQLQYFFKSMNIDYCMCNSIHAFTDGTAFVKDYIDFVDQSKYYNMLKNDQSFYIKYRNLGYTNEKAKYWHHSEVPHRLYADELIKFMGNFNEKNQKLL